MTLSSKDKHPNPSGWGYTFNHTVPQRRLQTVAGNLLVPASADDLPKVPDEHLATVERAVALIADLLSDRDHQLYMGAHLETNARANDVAFTLRRLIGPAGMLRAVLGGLQETPVASESAPADLRRLRDNLVAHTCQGCDNVVPSEDSLDVTQRCGACRSRRGLPPMAKAGESWCLVCQSPIANDGTCRCSWRR